jgi:hypothetical protein
MSTRAERILLAGISFEFFHCPTSEHIAEGMRGDDKAMCRCGQLHRKAELQSATAEEYVDYDDARLAKL